MYRTILLALILPMLPASSADAQVKEKTASSAGKWEIENSASKRFETPLGAVYRFQPRNIFRPYTLIEKYSYNQLDGTHGPNCGCERCVDQYSMSSIQCRITDAAAKHRYLMFEFSIRNFPAFEKTRPYPLNCFTISFSRQNDNGADFDTLHSVLRVHGKRASFHSRDRAGALRDGGGLYFSTGEAYMPFFEPQNIRLIYDTRPLGLIYLVVNGERRYIGKHEEAAAKNPPRIRSIGITIEKWRLPGPDFDVFFEISTPKLTAFNQDETLLSMLNGEFKPYPADIFTKVRKFATAKNPDSTYLDAIKLLYGADGAAPEPERGFVLLRRGASDFHLPSLYMLGVCYFYGLGVAPDAEQALKHLESARQNGYLRAEPLIALIEFQLNKAKFIWPGEAKEKIVPPGGSEFHDTSAWSGLFGMGDQVPLEYSFRHALRGAFGYGFGVNAVTRKQSDGARADRHAALRKMLDRSLAPELPIRLETGRNEDRFTGFDVQLAEEAARAGYAPAQYALAVALDRSCPDPAERKRLKIDERVDALLKSAADRGFNFAVLEQIRRKLLKKENPRGLITPQIAFDFAEDPWFLGLVFAMENPDSPWVRPFLNRKLEEARRTLPRFPDRPEERYLLGLLTLMHPDGPQRSLDQRSKPKENPYCEGTFELFVPMHETYLHAQYLVGKFLLEHPEALPSVGFTRDSPHQSETAARLNRGVQLLRKAGQKDHLKSLYWLAVQEKNKPGALRLLELPCHDRIPAARLLRARIIESFQPPVEIRKAYESCAELDSIEAVSYLARNTTDPVRKSRYYQILIKLIEQQRCNDLFDFYYPEPEHRLKQSWINSDLLSAN